MGAGRAVWRRVFDATEQAVTPPLEALVRTEEFSRGAALALRLQAGARNRAGRLSSRVWHTLNLPAGTDVQRLRWQLGAMDRELRRLSMRLDQHLDADRKGAGSRPELEQGEER